MEKINKLVGILEGEYSKHFTYDVVNEKTIDIERFKMYNYNMSEREYNKLTKKLDEYIIENDKYKLYFSYDTSGYYYWNRIMEEDNHMTLVLEIIDFNIDQRILFNNIDNMLNEFDNYIPKFY